MPTPFSKELLFSQESLSVWTDVSCRVAHTQKAVLGTGLCEKPILGDTVENPRLL